MVAKRVEIIETDKREQIRIGDIVKVNGCKTRSVFSNNKAVESEGEEIDVVGKIKQIGQDCFTLDTSKKFESSKETLSYKYLKKIERVNEA
jgi:hypothetical protein